MGSLSYRLAGMKAPDCTRTHLRKPKIFWGMPPDPARWSMLTRALTYTTYYLTYTHLLKGKGILMEVKVCTSC